jgi:hypothetical protein
MGMLWTAVILMLAGSGSAFATPQPTSPPTPDPTHSQQPTAPSPVPTLFPTVNVRQDAALTVLYQAMGGANWLTKTNWMKGDPCNVTHTWYGLVCESYDSSGRLEVNRITLNKNRYSNDSF